jgi:D-lactate dehydrogenase
VDYTAVKRLGMRCCNVPFYAPEAIAEHTILMALRVLRHEKKCSAKVAAGDYTLEGLKGRQLGQLTAGVLGTGRIGRTTMSLLNGFGARVLGWDPYPNEAAAKLCTYVERDELLKQSDIIFLHCPLTPDSYHVIGRETLGMMREGAVLINTARGGLVDQNAVLEALESGRPDSPLTSMRMRPPSSARRRPWTRLTTPPSRPCWPGTTPSTAPMWHSTPTGLSTA